MNGMMMMMEILLVNGSPLSLSPSPSLPPSPFQFLLEDAHDLSVWCVHFGDLIDCVNFRPSGLRR